MSTDFRAEEVSVRRLSNWLAAAVLLMVPWLFVSCTPTDVNELRRNYSAELSGWIVKERPAAVVDEVQTVTEDAGEDATAGEEAGEEPAGQEMEDAPEDEVSMAQMPASQDVLLDIVLRHEGAGSLSGITLDVSQADASEQEKNHWRVYVDTSDLAVEKRVTHTLEDVEVADDDKFAVEIRQNVPPEEQDEYKEFSEAEGS